MRKSVYKGELHELFQKINDSTICNVIEEKIFEPSYDDRDNKQFFIKDEIKTLVSLEKALNDIESLKQEHIAFFCEILDLSDDLKIPAGLKKAILNEEVILFIGAGVSKSLKYPSWVGLANLAINHLYINNKINNFEKDKLEQITDPKEVLTIFDKFCSRTNDCGRDFYQDLFKLKSSTPDINIEELDNIYHLITKKIFRWKYVTTNIDKELINAIATQDYIDNKNHLEIQSSHKSGISNQRTFDEIFSMHEKNIKVIGKSENIPPEINSNITFLHGVIDEIENTVFTTKDYLNSYFKNKSSLQNILKNIFKHKTVLFIGYGLSEFPILETIINYDADPEKKHYSLYPTFHSDVNSLKLKQKAFNDLSIELIPYYLDFNGHDRLKDVIYAWYKIIKHEIPEDFIDKRNLIDEVI